MWCKTERHPQRFRFIQQLNCNFVYISEKQEILSQFSYHQSHVLPSHFDRKMPSYDEKYSVFTDFLWKAHDTNWYFHSPISLVDILSDVFSPKILQKKPFILNKLVLRKYRVWQHRERSIYAWLDYRLKMVRFNV